jgi:hypothetical protein
MYKKIFYKKISKTYCFIQANYSKFFIYQIKILEKKLHKLITRCYDIFIKIIKRAVSSAVERLPYKQVVTGSNPVPPNAFTC